MELKLLVVQSNNAISNIRHNFQLPNLVSTYELRPTKLINPSTQVVPPLPNLSRLKLQQHQIQLRVDRVILIKHYQ
jgi:hypothetical protein